MQAASHRASRFVNLYSFGRAPVFCGAERQDKNWAYRIDPVRQASLSKAEASHPHSKVFTNPDARRYKSVLKRGHNSQIATTVTDSLLDTHALL